MDDELTFRLLSDRLIAGEKGRLKFLIYSLFDLEMVLGAIYFFAGDVLLGLRDEVCWLIAPRYVGLQDGICAR